MRELACESPARRPGRLATAPGSGQRARCRWRRATRPGSAPPPRRAVPMRGDPHLGLGVDGADEQPTAHAIHRGVDARDEPVAVEHRHRVVPVPALVLGDVDLHPVREIEQQLRAGSVGDQVVERRQHRGAWLPPAAFDPVEQRHVVPVHVPGAGHGGTVVLDRHAFDPTRALELGEHAPQLGVPVPGEVGLDLLRRPDPETVERTIDRSTRDLEVREALARRIRRQDAFGQVPELLDALATRHHDRAGSPQEPQHPIDVALVRPAARTPRLARQAARDPAREHGAVAADLREHRAFEPRVGRHPVQAPSVPPRPVVAGVLPHVPRVDGMVLDEDDRGRVRPVLVDRAVAPQQPVQVLRVEPRDPAPEHQQGAPSHDRDRVELHAPDGTDDAEHRLRARAGRRTRQALDGDGQSARRRPVDRSERSRHAVRRASCRCPRSRRRCASSRRSSRPARGSRAPRPATRRTRASASPVQTSEPSQS